MLERFRALVERAHLYDAVGSKSVGIGWPNVGWGPPPGYVTPSSTGVTISPETSNTVAAWYDGVRVISEDVASLPLITYRRGPETANPLTPRGKFRATDDPVYALLHDSPNPEMTSMVFRELLQSHVLTWGNGFAEKQVNGSGRTIALWPLRPDRMTVYRDSAGRRAYRYRVTDWSTPVEMAADRVFHLAGLGFDGLQGYSVLKLARETLGIAIALREYGGRVLEHDARPGVILKHPKTLSDMARANLRASWEDGHGGFTNAGRTALLEEGMDVSVLGFPPEDILFLESQKWQVTEVARWLRLAPHKIGDLERATFSNIEEQNIDHVTSTIRPWCVRWEQQLNKDVIQDPALFCEHLLDGLLRGKTLERYQAYDLAVQRRSLTPNEWRERENLNPVPWGDEPESNPNNTMPAPRVTTSKTADAILTLAAKEHPPTNVNVKVEPATAPSVPVHITTPPVTVEAPLPAVTNVNVEPAAVSIQPPDVNINVEAAKPAKRMRKTVERDAKGQITAVIEDDGE